MARKDWIGSFWGPGLLIIVSGVMLLTTGCKKPQTQEAPPVPLVEVGPVLVKDVPIYSEWTASTDGFVNATIRAQVQGYLVEQDYKEGDFVLKGQVLFKIDPRFLQAALEQARGQFTEQRARWENARANLERIRPLVAQKAISLKDFDDAVASERATLAAVVAAQAVVDKALVDLEFTRIISPIDGIAGIARAQLGNLVGPGSIEELTTVSTVDPIKVYFPMSEQEYLKYMANGNGKAQKIPLELILAAGIVHPYQGKLAFADRQVDIRTGTIKVAALFKNPGNVIRPGQFARIRARTSVKKRALLIPQRAVMELQGKYQAAVVGSDNKISIRQVKAAERIGNLWVIEEGLKSGEQVVTEGLQKVKDGTIVVTKPFRPDSGVASMTGPQPAIQKTGKK
ncbi:MAG: efflux RND transporter periplasmic adaptor subunit [Deltaproteobacteria bacterium]|nr:efflux RND transporter periplasmic adaptor subunit [Deltaproteobacteria bacterium]